MPKFKARPASRLAALAGGNLFAEFTQLSVKHGSANLGQGFPSFGAPPFLTKSLEEVMHGDVYAEKGKPDNLHHQYSRPGGEPSFANMLAGRYGPLLGQELSMENVVTTIGAQEGIYTTMHAFCDPGDEANRAVSAVNCHTAACLPLLSTCSNLARTQVLVITPAFDATFKSANLLGLSLKGVSLKPNSATATSTSEYQLDIEGRCA